MISISSSQSENSTLPTEDSRKGFYRKVTRRRFVGNKGMYGISSNIVCLNVVITIETFSQMELEINVIDAFTDVLFKGNSAAAVIITDDWLPVEFMQSIAIENNLSEKWLRFTGPLLSSPPVK